jgi:hypothetical protein
MPANKGWRRRIWRATMGTFIAPHGITVNSHGDIYVSEVNWTSRGKQLDPPREQVSLRKLQKVG